MLEGNIAPAMMRFAIPIILTGVLQNFYNTADNIIVGNVGGTTALAAVGATGTIISVFINVSITLFVGMTIMLARQLGAGDREAARKTSRTGYAMSLGIGLLILLLGQLLATTLLDITDCPKGEVYEGAEMYLRIYFLGAPFSIFSNYAASVLRVTGDSRSPFIYFTISGATNVLLNIIFVLLFGNPVFGHISIV